MNERQQQAFNNLLEFRTIMEKLRIDFWIDGGTLLGFYRDSNFAIDDEDDIDLGCWDSNLEVRDLLVERCKLNGFKIYHVWEKQIAVVKDGLKIDLFFHGRHKDNAFHFLYRGKEAIPAIVPLHFFEKLDYININNETFLIPEEIEEYLTFKYGDWKTPIHRKDYAKLGGCYNPEVNKVLQPNYKFN